MECASLWFLFFPELLYISRASSLVAFVALPNKQKKPKTTKLSIIEVQAPKITIYHNIAFALSAELNKEKKSPTFQSTIGHSLNYLHAVSPPAVLNSYVGKNVKHSEFIYTRGPVGCEFQA
jgi:hypothetical protein